MSSITTSKRSPPRPAAIQSELNPLPADNETNPETAQRVPKPLNLRRRSFLISPPDLSHYPVDTEPFLPHQDMLEPSCPTNNPIEPPPSVRVPRPGRQLTSSRSLLNESLLSSEPLTPPTSNESGPSSGSAGPTQHSALSSSCPLPSHRPFAPIVHPSRGNIRPLLLPDNVLQPSQSSPQSFPGHTLVDQTELSSGFGSAVLLEGSTILKQRFYEAYRYKTLHQYFLALRALSQSLPINGLPIHKWPEATQGPFPFLDFTDVRVLGALSYFSASVSALTPGLIAISPIGENKPAALKTSPTQIAPVKQDYLVVTWRNADGTLQTRSNPNDPWSTVVGFERRRQALERPSQVYERMAGFSQTPQFGPERGGNRKLTARRLFSSETRVSRIVPREIFARQSHTPIPSRRENSAHQFKAPAWIGVSQEHISSSQNLPATRISRFQNPSNTRRWHRSPPTRLQYPLRPTYIPAMSRSAMGCPANRSYLSRTVPVGMIAAPMRRVDFGHGSNFTAPRPVSGYVVTAMQRMARMESSRGRGMARGRGTGHGRYRRWEACFRPKRGQTGSFTGVTCADYCLKSSNRNFEHIV